MQNGKIELSNFFLCVLLCPLKFFFYNEHILTLWFKGGKTFTLKEKKFKKKQNHVLNLPSSSFYRAQNLCSYLARATQRNEAGVLWSLFNHALITLDSCRKLLLSLTLDFPLGFGGKETPTDSGCGQEGSSGLEDSVLLLPLAEGRELWAKWPLRREGTPTPVISSYCDFEILPELPKLWEKLGGMWRSERKNVD